MRKRTVKCKMIEKLREVEKSKKSQEKLEKNLRKTRGIERKIKIKIYALRK
jgi:hypothetical protein